MPTMRARHFLHFLHGPIIGHVCLESYRRLFRQNATVSTTVFLDDERDKAVPETVGQTNGGFSRVGHDSPVDPWAQHIDLSSVVFTIS